MKTKEIKQKNIFDHLNNLTIGKDKTYYKNLTEKERKDYNLFMLQRYISMDKRFTNFISFIDKYVFNCYDKEMYNKLMMKVLPNERIYFQYVKKNKSEKIDKLIIELLSKKFEISQREAEEYIQYLDNKDIVELLRSYAVEEKIIKKYID